MKRIRDDSAYFHVPPAATNTATANGPLKEALKAAVGTCIQFQLTVGVDAMVGDVLDQLKSSGVTVDEHGRRFLKSKLVRIARILKSKKLGHEGNVEQILSDLVEESDPSPPVASPVKIPNPLLSSMTVEVVPLEHGPCYALRPALRHPSPTDVVNPRAAFDTASNIPHEAQADAHPHIDESRLLVLTPSRAHLSGDAPSNPSAAAEATATGCRATKDSGRIGSYVVPSHSPPLSCLNTAYVSFDPIPRRKGDVTQEGKVPLPPLKAAVHGIEDFVINEDIRHRGVEEILRYVNVYSPNVLMVRPRTHPLSKKPPHPPPPSGDTSKSSKKDHATTTSAAPLFVSHASLVTTRKQRKDREDNASEQASSTQESGDGISHATLTQSTAVSLAATESRPLVPSFTEGETVLPTRLNAQLFHLCGRDEEDLHLLFDKDPAVIYAAVLSEHSRNIALREHIFRAATDVKVLTHMALLRDATMKSLANCEEVTGPDSEACMPFAGGNVLHDLIRHPGAVSSIPSYLRCPFGRRALALYVKTAPFHPAMKLAIAAAVNHCLALSTTRPTGRHTSRSVVTKSTVLAIEAVAGFVSTFCTAAQGMPGGRAALVDMLDNICSSQQYQNAAWWLHSDACASLTLMDRSFSDVPSTSALAALAPWCFAIANRAFDLVTRLTEAAPEDETGGLDGEEDQTAAEEETWELCVEFTKVAPDGGLDGYSAPDDILIRFMD